MAGVGQERGPALLRPQHSALLLLPQVVLDPQASATDLTRLSDWCVFRLSAMNTQPANGSVATVCSMCAAKSPSVRVGPSVGARMQPHQTSRLAVRHNVRL